jgi:hypothetical protein
MGMIFSIFFLTLILRYLKEEPNWYDIFNFFSNPNIEAPWVSNKIFEQ